LFDIQHIVLVARLQICNVIITYDIFAKPTNFIGYQVRP